MVTLRYYLLGILFGLALPLSAQNSWVKHEIEPKIELELPEKFRPLSDGEYSRKYGAYRPPLFKYHDPELPSDFIITEMANRSLLAVTPAEWKIEDLDMIKGLYKSSIAQLHSEITFLRDTIEMIHEQPFIVLEFLGKVEDDENTFSMGSKVIQNYSYIQYTIIDRKIHVFNFNCPQVYFTRQKELARTLMQKIKVKK